MSNQPSWTSRQQKTPTGVVASLLVSRELKWTYLIFQIFLLVVGMILLLSGLVAAQNVLDEFGPIGVALLEGVPWWSAGLLILVAAFGLRAVRRYLLSVQEAAVEQAVEQIANIEIGKLREEDFETYDKVRRLHEDKAQIDFKRNLSARFVMQRLDIRGAALFPKAAWDLQPGVNVLLGRNGYGKSLLLRAVAGLLQRDEEATEPHFGEVHDASESQFEMHLTRDGEPAVIRRNPLRFVESVGKIPVLAIPDSRLFDRSQQVIAPPPDTIDLKGDGADHFLRQKPYGTVIHALLYELCLDYWEHGRKFDRPAFRFLEGCMQRLTGSDFRFHSIARSGRTGFEIKVLTDATETPLPIQSASQGTLSVLALFGLIRSYLRSLASTSDDLVQTGAGIVLIDEADAHLHPTWQQKVPTLLRDLFPNVQFVLSAHSPLFVAGCWKGEVAVLRKSPQTQGAGGFTIEQLDRDFIGATSAELYQQIFDVEEVDSTYAEYSTRASRRIGLSERINELARRQQTGRLSAADEDEFRRLAEESRRIRRAIEVKEQRFANDKDLKIAELESKLLKLETTADAEEAQS